MQANSHYRPKPSETSFIFRNIITNLKQINVPENNTDGDKSICAGVLIEMYDIEKNVNSEFIQDLIHENASLKNEIRVLKSQLMRYYERTSEIVNILEHDWSGDKFKEKVTSVQKRNSNYPFENSDIDTQIDNDFYNSLSQLRNYVQETSIRLRAFHERNNKRKAKRSLDCSKITSSSIITKPEIFKGIDLASVSLYDKVPRLIPEEFVEVCCGCNKNFSVCRWKYHCRVCGYVFCFYCCWNFDTFLPFYAYHVRVCNKCVGEKNNICFIIDK